MKIISIDPGFDRVGIAILEKGSNKHTILFSECFNTDKNEGLALRTYNVGQEIERVIKKYSPKAIAIEKLYVTNNQKTAMGVAEARGVIIYEATKAGLPLFEYTPGEIKVAVTGYGKADKAMVMNMVPKLINLAEETTSDDELDAIAIGLTCFAREKIG